MTTVCELVAEAKGFAERAKAKLLLSREGDCSVPSTAEMDVGVVLKVLDQIGKAATAAAVRARQNAEGVAGMLTPSPRPGVVGESAAPSCFKAPEQSPTVRVPRVPRAFAADITDVIEGSLADMAERIERSR